jgi:MFS family permease
MSNKTEEYRRGWPVLVASAIGSGVGVAPIVNYSMGALIGPLSETFGWSRAAVGASIFFYSFGVLAAGAIVGGLADRFGARRVAIISQVALAITLACLTMLTSEVWSLYVGYVLLAVFGAGTLPMIWGRAIVGWFTASRGVALGLSLMGTGVVGALLPSFTSWLAADYGWRTAYLGMAALPLVLGLPLALLFFREAPSAPIQGAEVDADEEAPRAGHSFLQAISTLCFWQMSVAFIIVAIAISGVLVHSLPLFVDRGMPRETAAALVGVFGIAVLVGRLISGYFLDVFKTPLVGAVMFMITAVACGGLLMAGDNLLACGAAILCVGLSAGAESDIAAYLVAKYFGRAHYSAIYGLLYALFGVGGGVGPLVAGAVFDRTGSYDQALLYAISVFVLAAVLLGLVRPPRALPVRAEPALAAS